jgi:hypothetical protein
MTSALDGLDTRAKAAAIISGRKLDMLEQAGLMVVGAEQHQAMIAAARALVHRYSKEGIIGKACAGDIEQLKQALEAMERE